MTTEESRKLWVRPARLRKLCLRYGHRFEDGWECLDCGTRVEEAS